MAAKIQILSRTTTYKCMKHTSRIYKICLIQVEGSSIKIIHSQGEIQNTTYLFTPWRLSMSEKLIIRQGNLHEHYFYNPDQKHIFCDSMEKL